MKTTWYLHSHVVWLKAWYSSIGGVPLVCVAAHGGNPLMDCRIRQTATASPAEPGGLSLTLALGAAADRAGCGFSCDRPPNGKLLFGRFELARLQLRPDLLKAACGQGVAAA